MKFEKPLQFDIEERCFSQGSYGHEKPGKVMEF